MDEIIISPENSSVNKDILSNNIDDIIDLYFNLKETLTPNFLEYLNNSVPLTQFIINILINGDNNFKQYTNPLYLKNFREEYCDELVISYDLVANFLKLRKKHLNKNIWEYFCYYYTLIARQ